MLTETKIIQRHDAHQVMAQRYEILWRDGSTVGLHAVHDNGVEHAFLRAIEHRPSHWIVVDLRDLAPDVERDIKSLPRRDAIGVVFHTLRLGYSSAASFLARAIEKNRSAWFAGPPGCVGMAKFARVPIEAAPLAAYPSWLARMAGAAA